jgi:hypothetical protein
MTDIYLDWSGPSEECGCPEEQWVIHGALVTIHGEGDGTGHVHVDYGDWDHEIWTETDDLGVMKQMAIDYIEALPSEEDVAHVIRCS